MLRLIGVGDNTVDTYIGERIRYPGGNAVNVAVLAKRYGAKAAYLGALGADECGDLILNSLQLEGVEVSHCKQFNTVSNAFVEVDIINGERVFGDFSPGAAALLTLTKDDYRYIEAFDAVHSSIYSHLEDQIAALRQASKFLSFDFSSELDEMEFIHKTLPFVDMAIFSVVDIPETELLPFASEMYRAGPRMIVMTQGGQGAWVFDGHDLYHQNVIEVDVVDTMGAGDAYVAAFVIEYLQGAAIKNAMKKAAYFAASTCKYEGAFGYGQKY